MLTVVIWILLLGGLWGAFVLPSFLDAGADAPHRSTRSFEDEIAKLATLSVVDPAERARRDLQNRRRRTLTALAAMAVVTLVVAIWQTSWGWAAAHVVFDGLLIAYVLKLVEIRNRENRPRVIEFPGEARRSDDPESVTNEVG